MDEIGGERQMIQYRDGGLKKNRARVLAPLAGAFFLLPLGCATNDLPGGTVDLATCQGAACACGRDSDCRAGLHCDPAEHTCVACVTDVDCPSMMLCHANACVRGCSVEHGCGDAGICSLNAGVCLECSIDAVCHDPA